MTIRLKVMTALLCYLTLVSVFFGMLFSWPVGPFVFIAGLGCLAISQVIAIWLIRLVIKTEGR